VTTEARTNEPELVAIASGLVQVFLPDAAPILRPGEALLVDTAGTAAFHNLSDHEALLYWLTRQPAGASE
jgi:hypothetical protein